VTESLATPLGQAGGIEQDLSLFLCAFIVVRYRSGRFESRIVDGQVQLIGSAVVVLVAVQAIKRAGWVGELTHIVVSSKVENQGEVQAPHDG